MNAQTSTDTSLHFLTHEQMREDVEFYYKKLLETHPNPYQQRTPEQLEQLKNEVLSSFNYLYLLSQEEFYKRIAVFNEVLDEHTQILDWDLLAPMSEKDRQERISRDDKTAYPYRLFCFPEDSIVLLELNTFITERLGLTDKAKKSQIFNIDITGYAKILSKIVDSILDIGCRHLFIDVSANGGGSSSLACEILTFLQSITPQKYYIGCADIKVSNASRKMWPNTFSSKWDYLKIPFKKEYRQMFLGKKGKIVHQDFYWNFKGKKQTYNGNVYLVQSRSSYSATVSLCSFFKAYHVGPIIGEETGGKTNEYTNCYPFILPNSKYTFICAVQYAEDVGSNRDGRGVLPDIEYKIDNPRKSFTLEQLKEMLQLVEEKKAAN